MPHRDRTITYLLWTASILWLCLCLFLSWQKGDNTVALSGKVAVNIKRVIHLFGIEVDLDVLDACLRKGAHVGMFYIMGILFCCSFHRSWFRVSAMSVVLTISFCSVCAVVAEVGKVWIPGRHLQWSEVLLNVIGVVCGAGSVELAYTLSRFYVMKN